MRAIISLTIARTIAVRGTQMPRKTPTSRIPTPTPRLPGLASWSIVNWPEGVYPGSPDRARYLVRTHKGELLHAGALVRVGRELVILGDRYGKWLQRRAADVATYECNANRASDSDGAPAR
jgi:hypothetical protein